MTPQEANDMVANFRNVVPRTCAKRDAMMRQRARLQRAADQATILLTIAAIVAMARLFGVGA